MTDSFVYLINAWHFVWTKSSLRLCCHQHTRQTSDSVMLKCGGFFFSRSRLEKMRDYISASGSVDREHFELSGEWGQVYRVFGDRVEHLMEELSIALAA